MWLQKTVSKGRSFCYIWLLFSYYVEKSMKTGALYFCLYKAPSLGEHYMQKHTPGGQW